MLRKLLLLALASGLAKKGYDLYKTREADDTDASSAPKPRRVAAARRAKASPAPTHHRATTVGESS